MIVDAIQADLFALASTAVATARASDPDTSHTAADVMNRSGRTGAQASQVLAAVRLWNGRTSAELAELMASDRFMPARRLPDLARLSLVMRGGQRACTVTDSMCITWWPMPTQDAQP